MKSYRFLFALMILGIFSACTPETPPITPEPNASTAKVKINNQEVNIEFTWKQIESIGGDPELVELASMQLGRDWQNEYSYARGTAEVVNNLTCPISATYQFQMASSTFPIEIYLQAGEKKTVPVYFFLSGGNPSAVTCNALNAVFSGSCGGNTSVPNNLIDAEQVNVSKPCGIVISGNKIAVSEVPFSGFYNSTVKIWNSLTDFQNNQAPARTLVADEPEAMAVSKRTGHLAVSENWDKKVKIYDSNWQNVVATVGASDGLLYPRGVAFSERGDLYLSDDYNHRILRYVYDNNTYQTVGEVVLSLESNASVKDIALDAKGNLFVADYAYGLRRFDNLVAPEHPYYLPKYAMPATKTTAWLGNAVNLELKNNLLYVSYHNPNKIAVFDAGTLLAPNLSPLNATFTGFANEQQDVAVDDNGNVYVADYMGNKVGVYRK
ncbi:MAG: NHL repeat-containing protein [Bacteroidia bacterium]